MGVSLYGEKLLLAEVSGAFSGTNSQTSVENKFFSEVQLKLKRKDTEFYVYNNPYSIKKLMTNLQFEQQSLQFDVFF